MKRRVAPRLLTALIVTVLVGSAVMPGAAVAETPDPATPETSEAPGAGTQQPETAPAPSPAATVAPAPATEEPAPDNGAPPAQTPAPSPTVEKPQTESDDTATPAESDVMPDGPLKRCIIPSLAGKKATLVEITKLKSVSVDPSCALPDGTADPSNLPAMDDWTGVSFLSGLTKLTIAGFDGVTVPRKGLSVLAKIEELSLPDNQLTEFPDLGALPELTSLDLADNDLTQLTMPSVADAPRLTKLDVSKNQISDVAAIGRPAAGQSVDATDQSLTHPNITARAAQQLAGVITLPAAWGAPSWKPGTKKMASVDRGAGSFSAARAGSWSLSWSVREGKVAYSGSITGEATEPEPEQISFTEPGIVPEGDSATYRADVTNLPAADRSDLDYQWYRGTSKSALKPVDGATGQVFTIDSVSRKDDGSFVKLVAEDDGSEHDSTAVALRAQPDVDPGLERCLEAVFPSGFTKDDLDDLTRLDCSDRGIVSLNDLKLIGDDASVDLSSNLITDISPLTSDSADNALERFDQIDLSDNLISDVSSLDLADLDLSQAPTDFLNLDGNRISNVKVFAGLGMSPEAADRAVISIQRQVVGVAGVDAPGYLDVPGFEGGREGAINVAGDNSPLSLDGREITESPRMFVIAGLKELAWDVPVSEATAGVAFGGSFAVPVGLETTLELTFASNPPRAGDVVTARAYGFVPNETVTLTASRGKKLFRDQAQLSASADSSGMLNLNFTIGYLSGPQTVTAKGQTSGLTAGRDFNLDEDKVVPMPDDDLRACVNQQIGELPDAITYRSRLDKITTDFSCRNKGVKDLTGLDAIAAPSIDLTSNDISSLDTLKRLDDETTSLKLNNNELDRLGKVANQPNLQRLNLSQNQLTDFSALDDVPFAEDAEIVAVGQTIRLTTQIVGRSSKPPVVSGLDGEAAGQSYPDQAKVSDSSVVWTEAGDFRVNFDLQQDAAAAITDTDTDDEGSAEPGTPGLDLAGTFAVRVVNAAAPPATQPPSTAPVQQVATSPRVPSLAPTRLVERVERPDEDKKTSPRAVALGPEVALEEASPTPRSVTNPTVEKREPVTSVAGWGLTATGWSLLGVALLAMALAVGVAVLTLGRGTRGLS